MSRPPLLDDKLCEVILTGDGPVPDELWGLASLAEDARDLSRRGSPVPDEVLRAMFDAPELPRSKGSARMRQRAGAGARMVVGVSAALMALTGAAAADVLPGDAQHAVATVVNSVSPFPDLPDPSGDDPAVVSATTAHPDPASTGAPRAEGGADSSIPLSPAAAAAAAAAAVATAPDAASTQSAAPAADWLPDSVPPTSVAPPVPDGGESQPDGAPAPADPDEQGRPGERGRDRAATPADPDEHGRGDRPGKTKDHDKS